MLEQRRQEYLSVLGIDTFVPRLRIGGARPSRALVAVELPDQAYEPERAGGIPQETIPQDALPQEAAPEEAISQGATPQEEVLQQAKAQEPVAGKDITEESHPAPAALADTAVPAETPENAETKPPARPGQTLSFVLNIWSINDLVVVNTHEPGSALPVDKLLQNMLFAMGYPLAQLPPADMARWPLFKNDPNNSIDEARAMVQANIGARCSHSKAKGKGKVKVLLMGATAAQMVLAEESGESVHKYGYSEQREDWQASLLYLPSLVELLQKPADKKTVWQAWQGL